ncbi:MAG: DUF4234 domain-containing protein [Defluviitaleaceae bacterium]|nr:DUF4234 domain-containing protein [Defluviitaleaceae bacterium]
MILMEKRSIATCIILSIVTCGIYLYYWVYKIMESLYKANNMESKAGMDILLSIVTLGIYGIYLYYKMGKLESSAYQMFGLPARDDALLYLILGLLSYGIICWAIVQNNINNDLADRVNAAYTQHVQNQGGGGQM